VLSNGKGNSPMSYSGSETGDVKHGPQDHFPFESTMFHALTITTKNSRDQKNAT
jgi:hypothetical protein